MQKHSSSRFFLAASLISFFIFANVFLQTFPIQAKSFITTDANRTNYSPTEIVARAREWVRDHATYDQHGYYQNLYREDCSGLVSMAWGISPSVNNGGLYTGTDPSNTDQQYLLSSVADLLGKTLNSSGKPIMSTMLKLQKGDVLLNQSGDPHAILFVGWVQNKTLVSTPVAAKDGYYYYDAIEENGGLIKNPDNTYSGYAIEHTPSSPWVFPYYPDPQYDPAGYYAWRFDHTKAAKLGYDNTVVPTATIKPGGVWVSPPSPSDGAMVSDVLHLAAQAYPTHTGDPAISFVHFTVGSQGSWKIACLVTPPPTGDIFICGVNLPNLGISYGKIQVSFDVYDQAGNVNLAPNGVHTLMYVPSPGAVPTQPTPTPTSQPQPTPTTAPPTNTPTPVPPTPVLQPKVYHMAVDSSIPPPGVDTGIALTAGEQITITAQGWVTFGSGSDPTCDTSSNAVNIRVNPDGQRETVNGVSCPPRMDQYISYPDSP